MEDFKQYLSKDADTHERTAAEKVRQGLAGLHLDNKVTEVAAERRAWLRRRFWGRVALWATLIVIAGAAFLFFLKKEMPAQQPTPQQQIGTPAPPEKQPVPQRPPEQPQRVPIAEQPPPREPAEQPVVRSVQPELDSRTNRLIDILLRMTVNNDPSKKLMPHESLGLWAHAVRLLRKNKPTEAKTIVLRLEEKGGFSTIDAQWLLGIALLEEGKVDEARSVFEQIAQDPSHPRCKDAQLAVEALRKNNF